jgi:hypothetical protein
LGRVHDSNIGPRGGFLRGTSVDGPEGKTRAVIGEKLRRFVNMERAPQTPSRAGHGPRGGNAVQRRLTVTVNLAVALLPLSSVAEQTTLVRPTLNRVPERGLHVTGTESHAEPWHDGRGMGGPVSLAVTLKVTRAVLAFLGARTVLETAPLKTGGRTSKTRLGTIKLPPNVSALRPVVPGPPRVTSVPWPEAPAYIPEPPVTVKTSDALRTPVVGVTQP